MHLSRPSFFGEDTVAVVWSPNLAVHAEISAAVLGARCCVLRCFNFRCAKTMDKVGKVRLLS